MQYNGMQDDADEPFLQPSNSEILQVPRSPERRNKKRLSQIQSAYRSVGRFCCLGARAVHNGKKGTYLSIDRVTHRPKFNSRVDLSVEYDSDDHSVG